MTSVARADGAHGELGLPPGPRTPGTAQTLKWMFRPIPFMEECRERYGSVFSLQLGPGGRVVMISDPQVVKEILTGDQDLYRAGDTNGLFRPVVGSRSILLLDGEEHMHHRKIMLPGFGASHGKHFADQVREITERRIDSWEPGQQLRLQDEMEAISFESIMRVVFGDDSEATRERLRELIPEMMDRCDSAFTLLPWFRREVGGVSPYARLMRVIDQIDEVMHEAISERRSDPLTQFREDVLSLLVKAGHEDGTPLGDREIRDELLTLIMAGYETTTSGLAWALERLMRSPDSLQKLLSGLREDDDTYLDAVVKETLRSRPVVPVVARRLRVPAVIADFALPAGTILMVSIYLAHNDPETYPEPESFNPDRFMDGVPEGAAWIPFGGGVRRCLGASFAQLEMKTVLREVFSRVALRPVGEASEETRRKRFTFAPAAGALAEVEEVISATRPVGERRFPAEAARGTVNA